MSAEGRRQDHYEVLGVREDATDEVIRAAYRALVAKYHPDRNPGDRHAELKLKRLNVAFEVLGNPAKKRLYDELTQSPQENESQEASPSQPPGWKVPGGNESRNEAPQKGEPSRSGSREGNDDGQVTGQGSGPISRKTLPTFVLAIVVILGGAVLSGALALLSPALGILGALVALVGSVWIARARRGGRVFLKVFGYLVLASVVVVGSFVWYEDAKDAASEAEHEAEQAAITVEATYDPTRCTQERPISVVITNGSARTLKSVSFALRAFESGRSDDLAVNCEDLESDVIVPPGGTAKRCWKAPTLTRNAMVFFRAEKNSYPGAKFYESDEFIPPN
jgi:hypothetical protein